MRARSGQARSRRPSPRARLARSCAKPVDQHLPGGGLEVAVQRAGSGSIDEMHAVTGGAPQDHIGPVAAGGVVPKPGLDLLTRRGASVDYADHIELYRSFRVSRFDLSQFGLECRSRDQYPCAPKVLGGAPVWRPAGHFHRGTGQKRQSVEHPSNHKVPVCPGW